MTPVSEAKPILVTGATGYVGGRLLPLLVEDGWRVEAIEPGRRLRLAAEMKLPGRAWLEFDCPACSA